MHHKKGRKFGDCPILLVEALTIREALLIIREIYTLLPLKDSQIVIHAIMGIVKVLSVSQILSRIFMLLVL